MTTRNTFDRGRSARPMGCFPRQRASGEDVHVVVGAAVFAGANHVCLEDVLGLLTHRESQRCCALQNPQPGAPLGRHPLLPASDTALGPLLLQGTRVALLCVHTECLESCRRWSLHVPKKRYSGCALCHLRTYTGWSFVECC